MTTGIVFQVETSRVLEILAKEIYDSPLALLRENLQNAYDAVRMRFVKMGELQDGGRIDITFRNGEVKISDNGIGMTEAILREHFWKAGSSGKQSDSARKAGVVGTFGIGAMANFGVCTDLSVLTRADGVEEVLLSTAQRDSLRIAEECITLQRVDIVRDVGTTITAILDDSQNITEKQALEYLEQYAGFLKVPVYFNDVLISSNNFETKLPLSNRVFNELGKIELRDSLFSGIFIVKTDINGQVLVEIQDIKFGGNDVEGGVFLVQSGGQLIGLRSYFGLAPIPASGHYQFGGFANLSFLQPTAGREALSRESIDHVSHLITLAEKASSELISKTPAADTNNAFLNWVISNNRYELAEMVSINVMPDGKDIALRDIGSHIKTKTTHYYTGNDKQIISTFANESAYLLQVSQSNPRKRIHQYYVTNILRVPQVPDSAQILEKYTGSGLTIKEASILLRVTSILRDDYLIPDVEVILARISHGVSVYPEKVGDQLKIYILRSSPLLPPLIEFYDKAYELFTQFVKDFVRVHIYPRISQFVPSSTRDGVDALRKLLQRNRELYRYEESDQGFLEGVLGDYLSGVSNLSEVLQTARVKARPQTQRVSLEQVGTIENELPGIADSPIDISNQLDVELGPSPPIIRDRVTSDMKILTTDQKYPLLNKFTVLLGLSDRLMKTESEFFHVPHTTRILWGGHRVVYIFTEATGRLSLYYDIELRSPIEHTKAGGLMVPTTTLITKNRIFVPIPDTLIEEFKVASGPKEFYVRFDILNSDSN